MKWSKEDFLKVCNSKSEAARELLKEHGFCEEGLDGLIKKEPEKCTAFFTELTGVPFDPSDDAHLFKVLEKTISVKSTPEDMASALYFYFVTFTQDEIETAKQQEESVSEPVTDEIASPVVVEEVPELEEKMQDEQPIISTTPRVECRGRHKNIWRDNPIPFKPGSKQYLVISEMLKFEGFKKDFNKHLRKVFVEHGYSGDSTANYVWTTIKQFEELGGKVFVELGHYVVVLKGAENEGN